MKRAAMVTAERYHDISCGHRVAGHENKCAHLHGHNYRVTFVCAAKELDGVGRVIDFSVMKSKLCMWLEDHWDHRFLAWEHDTMMKLISPGVEPDKMPSEFDEFLRASIVWVPFNPTAENMALHLLHEIGPRQLLDTGVTLLMVKVEETRKCSATAYLD
jgi:6-pyruvoyltetrahydropterin/6-carboxytetrahydropterin synthase